MIMFIGKWTTKISQMEIMNNISYNEELTQPPKYQEKCFLCI